MFSGLTGVKSKKAQTAAFEQAYDARLNDADGVFLRGLKEPHSGPLFYWKNRDLIQGSHRLVGMMLLG